MPYELNANGPSGKSAVKNRSESGLKLLVNAKAEQSAVVPMVIYPMSRPFHCTLLTSRRFRSLGGVASSQSHCG